mmetsp:Transcript_43496/g.113219  ORF Transcript_43496/g.113219 Transcript_43496/m.113219 type:complete len:814 (-) Transcript_43496:218-2659(-)
MAASFTFPPTFVVFAALAFAFAAGVSVDDVDPFIGAGGEGFGSGALPVGPQRPFGCIRPVPDTSDWFFGSIPKIDWAHNGGYHRGDKHILAFSCTHLVGAGVKDLGNIGIMPYTGDISSKISPAFFEKVEYKSKFSQKKEGAKPHFYSVILDDAKTTVEMTTAGNFAALFRFTYSGSSTYTIVDLAHALSLGSLSGDSVTNGTFEWNEARQEMTGFALNHGSLSGRIGGAKTYFSLTFDTSMAGSDKVVLTHTRTDDTVVEGGSGGSGKSTAGVFKLPTCTPTSSTSSTHVNGRRQIWGGIGEVGDDECEVVVRIALSFVSDTQASTNREVQAPPSLTFDTAVNESYTEWKRALEVVDVKGGNGDDNVKFATAMYHAMLAPTNFTEVGGVYMGFDEKVHNVKDEIGSAYYTDMSIWDIHRTQAAFLTFVRPDVSRDVVLSLLSMAKAGGDIPRWPLLNGYTGCMIGTHAFLMILDAAVKEGISVDEASLFYPYMRASATSNRPHAGRGCLPAYFQYGYCPNDVDSGSVSRTLAFAYDDWAISKMAEMCGEDEGDVQMFQNRSKNYKNIFETKKKFFCGRSSSGDFHCPLIPELAFTKDYTEGNAWHYRFFVPQDVPGLITMFGGNDAFVKELEEFMQRSNDFPSNFLPNPYYWAGNEEDLLSPFEFSYAGRPDLSSKYAREQVEKRYSTKGSGIPGNDDYGTMSAWLFWASIGLYPEMGTGRFFLVAPLFDRVEVNLSSLSSLPSFSSSFFHASSLPHIEDLVIIKEGGGRESTTIVSASINGTPIDLSNAFVEWKDLVVEGGATLKITTASD